MTTDVSAVDVDSNDDLHCPVCDYSLRALPEPRCPECGYAFEWEELRRRTELRKGWFYEHAGTLKTHLKTRWKSLFPWSFWAQIHAYTDANAKRLLRYRLWTFGMLLVIFGILVALPFAEQWVANLLPKGRMVTGATTLPTSGNYILLQRYQSTSGLGWVSVGPSLSPMSAHRPLSAPFNYYLQPPDWAVFLERWLAINARGPSATRRIATFAAACMAMLLLLPLYWRLLKGSVLRANIRPVHLARVDAYSLDFLPLLLLLAIACEYFLFGQQYRGYGAFAEFLSGLPILTRILVGVILVPTLIVGGITLRLGLALRRYVRFPHTAGVALGYGIIVWLGWIILMLSDSFMP